MPADRKHGRMRSARLRSAIEFLTSIPLGTAPGLTMASGIDRHNAPSGEAAVNFAAPRASDAISSGAAAALTSNNGEAAKPEASPGQALPTSIAGAAEPKAMGSNKAIPLPSDAGTSTLDAAEVSIRVRGSQFRHITSRGQRASLLFRDALVQEGVLDGRIIFSRNKEYPSAVFSIIRYDAKVESALLRDRQAAAANLLMGEAASDESKKAHWLRWKGTSYASLLHAEHAPCGPERDETAVLRGETGPEAGAGELKEFIGGHPTPEEYDALSLDDPAIDLEKQRFTYNREGYMFSILAFRNERSQKDLINEKFARAHPWLDPGDGQGLTLTKIRSLKRRALNVWWSNGWEVSTVGLGIVFFEKLVFKRLVNKGNRKLAMAAALLLAHKMNDAKEMPEVETKAVVLELETAFNVPRKQILKAEFPVFTHLRFSMKVPTAHVSAHLTRLLTAKGTTPAEYLGPVLFDEYTNTAHEEAAAAARLARERASSGSSDSSDSHSHSSQGSSASSARRRRRRKSRAPSTSSPPEATGTTATPVATSTTTSTTVSQARKGVVVGAGVGLDKAISDGIGATRVST